MTKTYIAMDLHLGYSGWKAEHYNRIVSFLDFVEKTPPDKLVLSEAYELLWSNMDAITQPDSISNICYRKLMLIADWCEYIELIANHTLQWQKYQKWFPKVKWVENLEIEDFWLEHLHRFDELTGIQKPFYRLAPYLGKYWFKTPWQEKLIASEGYDIHSARIHDKAIRWLEVENEKRGKPLKGILGGHSHKVVKIERPSTGVTLYNPGSLSEDSYFLILTDGEIKFRMV